MEPIRLLLADDNADFRAAVLAFLHSQPGLAVIGQANDSRTALAQARSLRPDVVLLDVGMPDLNGLEAARLIGLDSPGIRIIMLLPIVSEEYASAALSSGAVGSVPKERLDSDLLPAIAAATRLSA
jgi:DNA-binding NarL/FixJ family response regulator